MRRDRVLAMDVGTSGVKAVVVDADRGVIASASRRYGLSTPAAGRVEQNVAEIEQQLGSATRELVSGMGREAASIGGLAVTAQMFNVQPMAEDGSLVGPMLSWLDQRAAPQAATLAVRVPFAEQSRRIGSVITAKDIVPRIHWLRDEAPEAWARTAWLLDCKEAVVAWLTGSAVIDRAGASAYRLTDVSGDWDADRCGLLEVPRDRLPPVADATDPAGGLTAEASTRLGLPAGLPVFVGAGDVPASQLGSGALGPGDAHLSLGTAVYLGVHLERPLPDPRGRLGVLCHALPRAWILWLEIATGGGALAWIGRALGDPARPDEPLDHAAVERLVESTEGQTDDLFFAPWLTGERVPLFDDEARGAFVGLSLRHGRGHLLRAVMEGVAYQIRWAYEYGLAYGVRPGRLRAVGGGGMGAAWLGIIADTLGQPLEVVAAPQDAAALGVAGVAFGGLGVWDDASLVARLVRVERTVQPDAARAARRERGFARFRALHAALAPVTAALHEASH